jgi:hypothetical protein
MKERSYYNITASVNEDILEIVATGDITESDTHEMIMKEIIDVEKSTNVKNRYWMSGNSWDVSKLLKYMILSEIILRIDPE